MPYNPKTGKFIIRMRRKAQRGRPVRTVQRGRRLVPRAVPRTRTVKVPGQFGFPNRMMVKLKYTSEILPFSAAPGGSINWNTFRPNSLFDPDFTNVGHQPKYRDQLAALYNTYRVYGCKLTVQGGFEGTAGNDPAGYLVVGSRTGSVALPASIIDASEEQSYKVKAITNQRPVTFSKYYSNAKIFGTTKRGYEGEIGYAGSMGGNPSIVNFLDVGIAANGLTAAAEVVLRVSLVYYCVLYDPLDVPRS